MIHSKYNSKKIDKSLVIQFAEDLVKEHLFFENKKLAIHAAIITSKKLAHVTAQKFYYEVIKYLIEKDE